MLLHSVKPALIATSLLMKMRWDIFKNFFVCDVPMSRNTFSTRKVLKPFCWLGFDSQILDISFIVKANAEQDVKMM